MGLLAGGLAAGGAIGGLINGTPASQVNLPPTYNYQNQPGADTNAYSGIGSLGNYNVAAGLLPQYQQIAQNTVNNPNATQYQSGAGQASNLGVQSGQNAYGAGGALTGSALNTLPDVNALLTLGFDPQNALYAQQQNQNMQQQAAINAQNGLWGTPYGAGVADQANTNFNLGWENNALTRASTAEQGAGALLSGAAGTANTGQNLQSGAAGQVLAGSGMPYSTFNTINSNALNTLGQTGAFGQSASVLPQQQIQDYLAYLAGGTSQQGANTSTANTALNQANSVFQQNQVLGQNLGAGLSALSYGGVPGIQSFYNPTGGWYGGSGGTGGYSAAGTA